MPNVLAVHVDHGLHEKSAAWAEFCRQSCVALGIPFSLHRLTACCLPGDSVEAWARQQRYEIFARLMHPGDMLLTAHHADDQAETVLAHLLRGSGPQGLAAMSDLRVFASGWHGRPFLRCSRDCILAFARSEQMAFLHDPANYNPRFRRSYIRKTVFPCLERHWPGLRRTLSRVARHQRDVAALLAERAEEDLDKIAAAGSGAGTTVLDVDRLRVLSAPRQANVLRHWLRVLKLPSPRAVHIDQLVQVLLGVGPPRGVPCVCWPGVEVRRHRQRLYALHPLRPVPAHTILHWQNTQLDLILPLGRLSLMQETQQTRTDGTETVSLRAQALEQIQVRFRHGGERINLAGSACRRPLKDLFREQGILPWYRHCVPLLYVAGQLSAVPGIGVSDALFAAPGELAWQVRWQHAAQIRAL